MIRTTTSIAITVVNLWTLVARSLADSGPENQPEQPDVTLHANLAAEISSSGWAPSGSTGVLSAQTIVPDLFTGTFEQSYTVDVPNGANGMQPNLHLVYRSDVGNGWLGLGWALEPGCIQLDTKAGTDYTGDNFVFRTSDGIARLVSVGNGEYRRQIESSFSRVRKYTEATGASHWIITDTHGTRYFYGSDDASRQSDPGNPARIFKWCLDRIEDLRGNFISYTYSHVLNQIYLSKILYTGHGGLNPTDEIRVVTEDRSDAFVSFETKFSVTTSQRLKQIIILTEGKPYRTVNFSYRYAKETGRSLLDKIVEQAPDGTELPATEFDYQDSIPELQDAPTFVPSGNGEITGLVFDKDDSIATIGQFNYSANVETVYPYGTEFVDLNGDGKPDMITLVYDESSGWYRKAWLNTGSGWQEAPEYVPSGEKDFTAIVHKDGTVEPGNVLFVDLQGTGRADLVNLSYFEGSGWWGAEGPYRRVLLNTGKGWRSGPEFVPVDQQLMTAMVRRSGHVQLAGLRFVDLNGDGRQDLLALVHADDPTGFWRSPDWWGPGGWYRKAWINSGAGWTEAPQFVPDGVAEFTALITPGGTQPGDFDLVSLTGNGLRDLVTLVTMPTGGIWGSTNSYRRVRLNTGNGWRDGPQYVAPDSRELTAVIDSKNHVSAGGTVFVDLNGDGRSDMITLIYDHGTNSWYRKAWLNTGTDKQDASSAWVDASEYVPGGDRDFTAIKRIDGGFEPGGTQFVDLNNSGLPALVTLVFAEPGGWWSGQGWYRKVFLNNGTSDATRQGSAWNDFPSLVPPGDHDFTALVHFSPITANPGNHPVNPLLTVQPGLVRFVDLQGSGRTGAITLGRASQSSGGWWDAPEWYRRAYLNAGGTDLLVRSSNGVGGTVCVEYLSSSGSPVSQSQLPFPRQVISKITILDGKGGSSSTSYEFSGGYFHLAEHEFRGFSKCKMLTPTDPNGKMQVHEIWFHQGNDVEVGKNNPSDAGGFLRGKPYRELLSDAAGNKLYETLITYAESPSAAPYKFNPPSRVDILTWDGTTEPRSCHIAFEYDEDGNVVHRKEWQQESYSARLTSIDFCKNPTVGIFSAPVRFVVASVEGSDSKPITQMECYYGENRPDSDALSQVPTSEDISAIVAVNLELSPSDKELPGRLVIERNKYDAFGNKTEIMDARGFASHFAYDSSGAYLSEVTNPLGHTTIYSYYGLGGADLAGGPYGSIRSITLPDKGEIKFCYDPFGRKTLEERPSHALRKWSYNNFGDPNAQNIKYEVSTDTNSSQFISATTYFDGLYRAYKRKDQDFRGRIVSTNVEFGENGAISRSSTPCYEDFDVPFWTYFTYDELGRITKIQYPDGSFVAAKCDRWTFTKIDQNKHQQRYSYDGFGNLVSVEQFADAEDHTNTQSIVTRYEYDLIGRLLAIEDAERNLVTFSYDAFGRVSSIKDPDLGQWKKQYDLAGNLAMQRDARGLETRFSYDGLNRLVAKRFGSYGPEVTYVYDEPQPGDHGVGRLTTVRDNSGTTKFFYDSDGRAIKTQQKISGKDFTMAGVYDGLDRLTRLSYPSGLTVSYEYDGTRLAALRIGSVIVQSFEEYDAFGHCLQMRFENGVTTNSTFDKLTARLSTQRTTSTDGELLQDDSYTYDARGNVLSIQDRITGTQTLRYDSLDQLTTATGPYGDLHYRYDLLGNLTYNSSVGHYIYPDSGPLSVHPHAVRSAGRARFRYDANGNMVGGLDRTMSYNFENQLEKVIFHGLTTKFIYGGDGRRAIKFVLAPVNESTFYVGPFEENVTNGRKITRSFDYVFANGTRSLAIDVRTREKYFYSSDARHSTRIVTGTDGRLIHRIYYEPYGKASETARLRKEPFSYKFNDKQLDQSTQLYDYGARPYDSTLGRFISADDVLADLTNPRTLNRYTYALNNPLRYTDPTGHGEEEGDREPKESEPKDTEPKDTEPKDTEPKDTEPKSNGPENNASNNHGEFGPVGLDNGPRDNGLGQRDDVPERSITDRTDKDPEVHEDEAGPNNSSRGDKGLTVERNPGPRSPSAKGDTSSPASPSAPNAPSATGLGRVFSTGWSIFTTRGGFEMGQETVQMSNGFCQAYKYWGIGFGAVVGVSSQAGYVGNVQSPNDYTNAFLTVQVSSGFGGAEFAYDPTKFSSPPAWSASAGVGNLSKTPGASLSMRMYSTIGVPYKCESPMPNHW
jgi:RHS repeat-associated protein